jgi:hypothetical protein
MTQNAESVLLRCPQCPWETAPERVRQDVPNGVWQARASLMGLYRYHLATAHFFEPVVVQIDGSGVRGD